MEKPRRSQGLTISSLASSKGGIYMNPDGGLLYCINTNNNSESIKIRNS